MKLLPVLLAARLAAGLSFDRSAPQCALLANAPPFTTDHPSRHPSSSTSPRRRLLLPRAHFDPDFPAPHRHIIAQAVRNAAIMARRAASVARSPLPRHRALLDTHFASPSGHHHRPLTPAQRSLVASRYNDLWLECFVRGGLVQLRYVPVWPYPILAAPDTDTDADAIAACDPRAIYAYREPRSRRVVVCDGAFTLPLVPVDVGRPSLPGLVLHELSHALHDTRDHAYGRPASPALTTEQLLQNADSYQHFALESLVVDEMAAAAAAAAAAGEGEGAGAGDGPVGGQRTETTTVRPQEFGFVEEWQRERTETAELEGRELVGWLASLNGLARDPGYDCGWR